MSTIQTLTDFRRQARPFVQKFNAFANNHQLMGLARVDHICYKCGSRETFDTVWTLFENESEYMHQTMISGRPIAYIKMKKSIETLLGPISFLELSDQKPDGSQVDGFDHVEVYPFASMLSYEQFVQLFRDSAQVVMHEPRPHHTTDSVDIEGKGGKGFLFRCTQGTLIEKIVLEMLGRRVDAKM